MPYATLTQSDRIYAKCALLSTCGEKIKWIIEMAYSDGNVQFIIHTDDFFIHLSEDFLEISPQYRGTALALFDVVIRKEY
jgi:hypothetical protein